MIKKGQYYYSIGPYTLNKIYKRSIKEVNNYIKSMHSNK